MPSRQYCLLLFTAIKGACALHLFKEYVFETQPCAGTSMLPTLNMAGDMLVINKWHYMYGRNIRIGDIIVVKSPDDPGVRMAKTVIGMGGDLVCMDPSRNMREYLRVPPGHVWVTGNNLSNSWDSRQMGPIPLALVLGKATHKLSFVKLQWPEPIQNALHLVDD